MVLQGHLERLAANYLFRGGTYCCDISVGNALGDIVVHSILRAIVADVVKGKRRGTDLTGSVESIAVEILDLSFSHGVGLIQRHGLVKETLGSW